jgi:hypothetical protein
MCPVSTHRKVSCMTKQETPAGPLSASQLAAISAVQEENRQTVTRRKRAAQEQSETALQTLHRLFGDQVYDLFPPELIKSVDTMHVYGKTHADEYILTPFDSERDKLDSWALIKAYCEIAPNGGYTIRVDWNQDANMLAWKIQDRRKRKPREDAEETAEAGEDE